MLRFRWPLVLTICAFVSHWLPAEMRLGVLAALVLAAGGLAAVTLWGRLAEERNIPASHQVNDKSPLRTMWSTTSDLPSPSGTQLRPSAEF